jgi:hypothetical protein
MDERKTAKGVGALATGGWSVATVNGPKWASTREPPGKSMIISMSVSYSLFFVCLLSFGCRGMKKVADFTIVNGYWQCGWWTLIPIPEDRAVSSLF